MIRCVLCFKDRSILIQATTQVWIKFDDGGFKENFICDDCDPMEMAKKLIESYPQSPGDYDINWCPMELEDWRSIN